MTPKQMLQRKQVEDDDDDQVITFPRSYLEEIFEAQSAVLKDRKCPTCMADITVNIGKDGLAYLDCVKNPTFHTWRRPQSFLTQD